MEESILGTVIRTGVDLVTAWVMVSVTGRLRDVRAVLRGEFDLGSTSGVVTRASWLSYFRVLQAAPLAWMAPSEN